METMLDTGVVTMVTIASIMKSATVKQIISALGGPSEVASLCEIQSPQAVSMWVKRRKIPQARLIYLRAIRPEVFAKLKGRPLVDHSAKRAA